MKILVIGTTSILLNFFKKNTTIKDIDYFSRKSINKIDYKKYTHLINFCVDPDIMKKKYSKINDIDKKILKLTQKFKIIYIFLSTRIIYEPKNNFFFKESDSKIKTTSVYGQNKKKIENNVILFKKKSHLILRLGTILYFSLLRRNLFISKMLNDLKIKGHIELDINKTTTKDFLTVNYFVKSLDILIKKRETGIYNLSSGVSIKIIDIANNIIKGYGKGKIIMTKKLKKTNSFLLCTKKINKVVKIKNSKSIILSYCKKIGKELINA